MPQQAALTEKAIVIVGPTGVGKTALAIQLARALGGEIVSADSRQIYRGMDVGTAKPSLAERAQVPHHLIDMVSPDQEFGLATFQEMAYTAIQDILARQRLPFLVGGTGQYIHAVVEGWKIPRVPPDPILRERLYALAEREGPQALYAQLLQSDPAATHFVDPRNVRRIVRALEVCLKSGQPFSGQRGKKLPPYRFIQIGLTMEREELYHRVDERIDGMIAGGLVEEVANLLKQGYDWSLPSMSSLGYIQLKGYFEGVASLDECTDLIKKETRRFIRHQHNWFRLTDQRIHWLDATQMPCTQARKWIEAQS